MQGIPIFDKIEFWVKDSNSITKHELYDSGLIITGNHFITVENFYDNKELANATNNSIYELSNIMRYKTYKK